MSHFLETPPDFHVVFQIDVSSTISIYSLSFTNSLSKLEVVTFIESFKKNLLAVSLITAKASSFIPSRTSSTFFNIILFNDSISS